MPAAIPAVAAMVASYGISTSTAVIMAVGAIGASVLGAVVAAGISYLGNSILGEAAKPGSSMGSFDSGVLSNKAAADAYLPVVYGSRLMGGYRVLVRTTGPKNEYLHIVLAICHGTINAISTVYLDGTETTDEKYDGLVTVTKYLGTDTQAADPNLVNDIDEWTTDHRLRGVAYLYVKIKYDSSVFSSIPEITAQIEGIADIYDPRDATEKYTDNPALCVRDYCTSTRYGRGIAAANFPDEYVIAEANHCDELVAKGEEEAKRYTCNGAIDTEQSMLENTKALLTSMRGVVIFSSGQYKLRSDRIGTSTFSLTEDNVNIAEITMSLGSLTNTFNLVEGKFFNPDEDSQYDYAIWDDEAARTADNGRELDKTVELKFTNDYYTALQIATLTGKASRLQAAMELVAQPEGINCEVFDVIDVTLGQYGFDEKLFRVMEMSLREDGLVSMSLLEYDDGTYDFGTIALKAARARTTLPSTSDVSAPTGLALESGTGVLFVRGDGTVASRVKVSWAAPADIFVTSGGSIEVQYKLSDDDTWEFGALLSGSTIQTFINDVQDGEAYDVRIRSINASGFSSGWVTTSNYTIVGKSELPPAPTSLIVQGDTILWHYDDEPLDHKGFRVRYNVGENDSWDRATLCDGGITTEHKYDISAFSGAATFLVKSQDTSGNLSEGTASLLVDIGDRPVSNIVITESYAPTFDGDKTNCTIFNGILSADGATDIWRGDDDYLSWTGNDDNEWWSPQFSTMTYYPIWRDADGYVGDTMLLDRDITAGLISGETIEYAVDADTVWLSENDDDVWLSANDDDVWIPAPSEWKPWTGSLIVRSSTYYFRQTINGGTTQGEISQFDVVIDADDIEEWFDDVEINATTGSRLPLTKTYRKIVNVICSLQEDGGTAERWKVDDKNHETGPLIKCYDASGNVVAGTIDARIQGY